jgi:hypothetical protein
MAEHSDQEKLACARRELALRQRVYPRLIEQRKLKPEAAARELKVMAAIVDDYAARCTMTAVASDETSNA